MSGSQSVYMFWSYVMHVIVLWSTYLHEVHVFVTCTKNALWFKSHHLRNLHITFKLGNSHSKRSSQTIGLWNAFEFAEMVFCRWCFFYQRLIEAPLGFRMSTASNFLLHYAWRHMDFVLDWSAFFMYMDLCILLFRTLYTFRVSRFAENHLRTNFLKPFFGKLSRTYDLPNLYIVLNVPVPDYYQSIKYIFCMLSDNMFFQ